MKYDRITRRKFLSDSGIVTGITAASLFAQRTVGDEPGGIHADTSEKSMGTGKTVALVSDPADAVAAAVSSQWALSQLHNALTNSGVVVRHCSRIGEVGVGEFCIVAAGAQLEWIKDILQQAKMSLPASPETLALASAGIGERTALFAIGTNARGLMYALLEVADRITHSDPPLAAIEVQKPLIEQPANSIRSIARLFTSDVEDLSWFRDPSFWTEYLSMLAAERFNRFNLTLGLGYDFTRQIRDCYFHFAYPFFLSVPGYDVQAVGLPDAERDKNLAMLRQISEIAVARGIDFQLGLWTHAYKWTDSPHANYTIDGLNANNHAAYCRDALSALLAACPSINGVTIRTHGESGVAEGNYEFWRTIFDGVQHAGRKVEIDLHAKGIDQRMIDAALSFGMPVNVSPKFSAEHFGLPYHQAAIRALELPNIAESKGSDIGINRELFSLTNGERKFMRYSYGDLLREDRRYGVLFRMWPGTQRLLLWGDPQMSTALGRAASFCGSKGMELCEPLSFKGRKGSGLSGSRTAYQEATLKPVVDWEKYAYTYRLWGRLLYNPDVEPEVWQRKLHKSWGAAAPAAEQALAYASRILPLVTSAHLPSAANNNYWPELYTNMSIVDAAAPHPYSDTPSPKRFGTVSPLDPELFCTIDECAKELISNKFSGKYSALEIAQWLNHLVGKATKQIAQVEEQSGPSSSADLRRLIADVKIQNGLGEFFEHKIRSGLLFAIYQQTSNRAGMEEALKEYQAARDAWAEMAQGADAVYVRDITFGMDKHLRGNWTDRLAAIDQDMARMKKIMKEGGGTSAEGQAKLSPDDWQRILKAIQTPKEKIRGVSVSHEPPKKFVPGAAVTVALSVKNEAGNAWPNAVMLCYRHVNQAENYQTAEMKAEDGRWMTTIPAEYSQSPFPLQYFFKLRSADGRCSMHPGLDASLCNQPYYVIRQV